jgi:hypothetical protein
VAALDDFLDSLLSEARNQPSPWAVGTVVSVDGATPPNAVVTWNGANVPAKCPRHYTPAAGHVVLMARVKNQLNILAGY